MESNYKKDMEYAKQLHKVAYQLRKMAELPTVDHSRARANFEKNASLGQVELNPYIVRDFLLFYGR